MKSRVAISTDRSSRHILNENNENDLNIFLGTNAPTTTKKNN